MALFDKFSEMIEKENLGEENNYTPTYSSGIDIVDYNNGKIDNGEVTIGFPGGRIITVIGKSGSGKTSFAIGMATHFVSGYKDGMVFHYDFERSTEDSRVKIISNWKNETYNNKYKILNRNIYSESIYQLIKGIDSIKNDPETRDAIKIDTGRVDKNGNPIYDLPPTVVLIDSWASMFPKDISEEEKLSGSMSASSIAKTNNAIAKRIIGPMERANITLIIINHITQKIEIGFTKTQAAVNYLKQD